MTTAYIGLGGNLGDVPKTCDRALHAMAAWPGISVTAVSPLYTTEPQGDQSQPWFSNRAAAVSCRGAVTPHAFLHRLQDLERKLGRVRDSERRFGPRVIDLDLLLFGEVILEEKDLTLPHPRMAERAFVLVPLLDIAPDLILPGKGRLDAVLGRLTYEVRGNLICQPQP